MNLLIVGRKSKTQMRNMFYWAGIISILICLPLRVSAQSYEQMWKQVEVLEQKQLPKSAIQELQKDLRVCQTGKECVSDDESTSDESILMH